MCNLSSIFSTALSAVTGGLNQSDSGKKLAAAIAASEQKKADDLARIKEEEDAKRKKRKSLRVPVDTIIGGATDTGTLSA